MMIRTMVMSSIQIVVMPDQDVIVLAMARFRNRRHRYIGEMECAFDVLKPLHAEFLVLLRAQLCQTSLIEFLTSNGSSGLGEGPSLFDT